MPAYYLEIIVVLLGLAVLTFDAVGRVEDKRSLAGLGVLGLVVVFFLLFKTSKPADPGSVFWKFYATDSLAFFFKGIAILTTIVVLLMANDFIPVLQRFGPPVEAKAHPQSGFAEFVALPLFLCAGLMWMASANHLVSIFVSLELVTVTFYVLVAYLRRHELSLEAGVKYLILGALSTGLLVYGLAWLYGATGALDLSSIEKALSATENPLPALFALAFILAAMAFKVGALPTAFWIPDVYQGAPTPVTALLAVGSKSAGFIVLMRLMTPFLKSELLSGKVVAVLAIMAVATLLYGNFAALLQTNVKRLLGYSSISHAGFLVLALASAPSHGGALETPATTVAFYLASYAITALLAFLVLSIVSAARHGDDLDSFRGLGKASPFLALLMLLSMASMAGVPLTIGFWGKFFVFQQAVFSRLWLPLGVAVIGAAAGFYYYFRLIFSMYLETATGADGNPLGKDTLTKIGAGSRIAMILLALAIIGFGFFPGSILALLR